MDCDDVTLMLADPEARTLLESEQARYHEHLAECDDCRALTCEPDEDRFRWLVRVPEDALDDEDMLVLPVVDPIVFVTQRELARGGMGRVMLARDRRLGRDVAIKEVLAPHLRARFEREVMITAQLQHPAIVPVYEAGTWPSGSAFYTMRLVSGGTLADAIAKAETFEQRLALLPHVIALTEALAYAHAKRIVHRDLKASNVLVGEFGETVVIDWGLAKELARDVDDVEPKERRVSSPNLTVAGAVMGTPGFMSPEQATGLPVDERTDVYALGAILYNLLAGHAPYADAGIQQSDVLIEHARMQPPTPIAEVAPDAPADLRAIVERAMARSRDDRYATAVEMAEELRRFEAGQLIRSRQYNVRELIARWIRRHRGAVVVGAIALVVVAAIGIAAIVNVARSSAAERDARQTAERAQATAETSVAALLEEQGREQLLAGERERGLAYLAEAYRRGRDTVALRHLLAIATRDLELRDGTLAGTDESVAIGFADDGRLVAVDRTGGITMWRGDAPVVRMEIGSPVAAAWLDPHAASVAIITADGHLGMYDTATGARRWLVDEPVYAAAKIVLDPTGARLVVLRAQPADRAAELRDAATGARLAAFAPSTKVPAAAAAFTPDGTRFTIGCGDGELGVWATATLKRIAVQSLHHDISAMAFIGEEVVAASRQRDDLQIYGLYNDIPLELSGHQGRVTAIAVGPRADMLAVADDTGGVRLWTSGGSRLGEARDHRGELGTLAFSPDGALLAGVGVDHRVYVWSVPALDLVRALPAYGPDTRGARAIAWSRDGDRFATASRRESAMTLWRRPVGHRVAQPLPPLESKPYVVTRHPVQVVETASVRVVGEFGDDAVDAAITSDGERLVVLDRTGRATAWRVSSLVSSTLPIAPGKTHVELDPTGQRVALYGTGGAIVVELATARVLATLATTRPTDAIERAQFDGFGRRLATWSDRTAALWNVDTATRLVTVDGVPATGMAVDHDGARFATASFDGTIRIWDGATARLLEAIAGDGTAGLAWRMDGTRLEAKAASHATAIWDVHLDMRSRDEIAALAERATPWRVVDGVLQHAR